MSFRFSHLVVLGLSLGLSVSHSNADILDEWFTRTSGTTNDLFGVAFASNVFLAVGNHGDALMSSNAVTWQSVPTDLTNTLYAVTHGFGHFVAAGEGVILVSNNTNNWSVYPQPGLSLRGVAYGSGKTVAVGHRRVNGDSVAMALSSTNGSDWDSHEMGVFNEITSVTFGNGLFVAGTGFNKDVLVSSNGVQWLRTVTACYNPRYAVTFGNNRYVAVGPDPYCPSYHISSSSDAFHWEDRQATTDGLFFGVTFGANTFVAVGGLYDVQIPASRLIISTDGLIWFPRVIPGTNDLHAVAYGNGTFVAVGLRGSVLQSEVTGEVTLRSERDPSGTALVLTVTGQANETYRLQASAELPATNWQDVSVITNAQNVFRYTNSFQSPPSQRFFRVVSP